MLLLIVAQAAAATAPDIELHAVVDVESVKIEKQGNATLRVYADPDAGSGVKIEAPRANGAKTLRNVRVTLDARARIASSPTSNKGQSRPQETDPAPQR
jgi:hypothetical protein